MYRGIISAGKLILMDKKSTKPISESKATLQTLNTLFGYMVSGSNVINIIDMSG